MERGVESGCNGWVKLSGLEKASWENRMKIRYGIDKGSCKGVNGIWMGVEKCVKLNSWVNMKKIRGIGIWGRNFCLVVKGWLFFLSRMM